MTKASIDNDPQYLARTADRLRAMSAAQVALADAEADEVRARLEHMTYGANRQRDDQNASNRDQGTIHREDPVS